MADITVKAAYGSVVEDEGFLYVGFAEGEEEDEGYVLFRRSVDGGPVWFEVNDEVFGADDAVERVRLVSTGIEITLKPAMAATFGWATSVAVEITSATEDATDALSGLAQMFNPLEQS